MSGVSGAAVIIVEAKRSRAVPVLVLGPGLVPMESSYFDTAARTSLGMRDITSDLLVFGVLVVAAGYALMNTSGEPFRLYLVMGGVAATMCLARVCRYGGY